MSRSIAQNLLLAGVEIVEGRVRKSDLVKLLAKATVTKKYHSSVMTATVTRERWPVVAYKSSDFLSQSFEIDNDVQEFLNG